MTEFELGPGYSWKTGGATLNLYYLDFDNAIVWAGGLDNNGDPVTANGAVTEHKGVELDLAPDPSGSRVRFEARARAHARTGVEMEALVAVAVAGLTLYDMCKAIDRSMTLEARCVWCRQEGLFNHLVGLAFDEITEAQCAALQVMAQANTGR